MDFSNIPIFNVMKSKLDFMSERQAVLAQNIANADSPGYRAHDLVAPDFKSMAMMQGNTLAMTTTSPQHLMGQAGSGSGFKNDKRKSTYELRPTGNNVVIEEEMSMMAQNQADYNKVLSLYHKSVSLFKTALGQPSNGS